MAKSPFSKMDTAVVGSTVFIRALIPNDWSCETAV